MLLRLYTPDRGESVALPAEWPAFRDFVYESANWSLEYVPYGASGEWAVLADPEVVVLGACTELASRIDSALAEHGTSLAHLTRSDFPGLDSAKPNDRFFLAVVGSTSAGSGAP